MRFALTIPLAKLIDPAGRGNRALVCRMAAALEAAGFDACLTSEHPAPSAEWLRTDPAAHDCVDPLTALAFVAGATERLQIFTNILVLPYRNPFMTAKAAATMQIMSDNRLLLGVGVGYMKEEFDALGVDHARRGALTDEAIEVIRMAWRGGPVAVDGMNFKAIGNEPRPVPAVPPPIWVGGGSDRAVERAARLGDGWVPYFSVPTNDPVVRRSAVVDMAHFGEKVARLGELRAQYGRTGPFDLAVAPPFRPSRPDRESAERFTAEMEELAGQGVNLIWTSVPARSIESYLEIVQWFGEEIIAPYRRGRVSDP